MNNNELEAMRWLKQNHVPARYPNGLPGGIPHEVCTEENAREALNMLARIIESVSEFVGKVGS